MTKTLVLLIALGAVGCKKKKTEAPPAGSASAAMEPGSAAGSAVGSATSPSAKSLALDTPMDLGGGVTLTFARKETAKGGDNQPPTYQHTVTAKCGGKDVVMIDRTDEGGDGKVSVEQPGGKVIATMNVHIAREGEIGDETEAATIDVATCAVTKK